MTKSLSILFMILLFFACKQEEPKLLNADSIELTYYDGWTGGVSMKINKEGIVNYIQYDIHGETYTKTCYKDTLSNHTFDSINSYLSKLRNGKIDSLYGGHCNDCDVFYFILTYPDTTIESQIVGNYKKRTYLTEFGEFLIKHTPNANNLIDSCTDFKTTKYLKPIPPPQPIDTHKFIPNK